MKKALIVFVLALAAFSAFAQKKTKVAVFPFEVTSGVVNETEAIIIREDFSNRLSQTGLFELVPRTEVDKLFNQEAKFQLNDLSDAKKTAEYGRVLNADWIMAGRLAKVGSRLALVVTMYTYPDFVQKPGSQIYASDIDTLVDSIPNMIADIQAAQGGGTAPATSSSSATPAKPAASTSAKKTYKIGDTGPAGGIVFYDKGYFDDGWQYLECAPANNELSGEWGNLNVDGTGTAIGTGKGNTQIIIEALNSKGQTFCAAQVAAKLGVGGFKDWFLPSKDELNLMYTNLKKKGLGGFSNKNYWSSSQGTYYAGFYNDAWYQQFSDGTQDDKYKYNSFFVRAIRQF